MERKKPMQTTKPQIQRTYVTAKDAITKEYECVTVYHAKPADVMRAIKRLEDEARKSSHRN